MELGIFSKTYEISDLEETCRRMISHGIYHTQFNLSNAGLPTLPEDVSDEELQRIRKTVNQYQVKLDALSGTFNMIDPDLEKRKAGCEQFREQCRIAKELDIPVVTLCTGSKHPTNKWAWHDDNLRADSWADLLRTTEQILKYAEEYDVILGVETETNNIINTSASARRYLDEVGSDRLKIIMDGANLFLPEQVPDMKRVLDEAFELLGNDIVIAHAKDFSCEGDISIVAVGEGVLDFPYYKKLLDQYGYQGPFIMHGMSEAQVPASCSFLKGVLENE